MPNKSFHKYSLIFLALLLLVSCARETPVPSELPAPPQVSVSQHSETPTALPAEKQSTEIAETAQAQNQVPPNHLKTAHTINSTLSWIIIPDTAR